MKLNIALNYTLVLSAQEYRVVCAALKGTLKPEWEDEAIELQDRLFKERRQYVDQLHQQFKGNPDH